MGYQVSTIRTLVSCYSANIVVVSWDDDKFYPYKIPDIKEVTFYKKSEFNYRRLRELINSFEPDIIVASGWIVNDYNKACGFAKKKGIKIVAASDTQWKSTLRQKIGVSVSKFYHRKYFDYLWVAGVQQFEYARRLRFPNNKIIYNCYSADLPIFIKSYELSFNKKKLKFPKTLLFAGRFSEEKGINQLIGIYNELKKEGFNWKLTLVGVGPLALKNVNNKQIEVMDYVQPDEFSSIIENSGVFILPGTNYEPWGLVVHEFAAAGMPIICSDKCGAATEFVINGFNGYVFNSEQKDALKQTLQNLQDLDSSELLKMGYNSHKLSRKITPETAAANLMSIL